MYISFVTKAILWDRGGCHHTPQVHYNRVRRAPAVCPRFLSHMKARPEDFHPPCYLNNNHQQQLPSEGRMQSFNLPPASQTDFLLGNSNTGGGRSGDQSVDLMKRRNYAAVLPRLQIPPTPPVSPSSFGPTPLQPDSPHLDPNIPESNPSIILTPETHPSPVPPRVSPQLEENVTPERETVFDSVPQEPDCDLSLKPSGSSWLPSPTSLSLESLSHLRHPSSTLFSRSINLSSGRTSILSDITAADFLDSRPETSVGSSTSDLPPVIQSPLASSSPTESTFKQPLKKCSYRSTSSLPEKTFDEFHQPHSPYPAPVPTSTSDKPQSIKQMTEFTENIDQETSKEDVTSLSPDKELNELRPVPRSGSGPMLSPSPPPSRLDSQHWPVLPPISPKRGFSAASGCSEISCSQSQMFDELEVIAPLSASSLSLDRPSDSSDSPRSPVTDLSPGLAALTVGCDSGNLGSLSRVQLLLLDRPVPQTDLDEGFSPVQEWSDLTSPYELPECISPGHSRPLTAGSGSERCDSAGKLQENKSNWSEGGSVSPSSWIADPSPSLETLRSSDSSLLSNEENPAEDRPHHPGRSSHVLMDGGRVEERDEAMEERKTKALSLLSKLQNNAPRRSKTSRSRSNFEDFDFLAKYCIFSQEKLLEYKRAFEAEDGDGDGYISCLQVLLALKTIIPPELLSEKEEIYVYRILEMVDFRVTDGLVDLRLFAVIASLAQKIASLDEFMRSLIDSMDLRSLEVRLFKAKLNELIVGDTSGKLLVYKNDESKPWITRTCVGMLTCVAAGDVCNKGKNLVVAVGAEGWFHLFDLTAASASKSDSSSQHELLCPDDQRPFFTQHIPANTKVILISDIDGDGRCELVVGYTDRVVRAFRWEEPSDSSDGGSGQLVLLKKWLLEGQVDSLSVNPGPEGLPELMVSQPGCGYAILLCTWTQQDSTESEDDAPATPGSDGPSRDVVLHLTSGRIHNKNVSTHLIGSISKGSKEESSKCGLFALCTLDGTLKLMDSSEQLLWSVQVDHQLFALQKLDVTGDGREEVVACAWDGQTYIIDHNRTVVRFQFDENVNAFCAGQYTCKEGKNSPCLVYVSFNQKIYIYWKVELERMESTNLLRVLEEKPEFKSQLKALGVDGEDPAAVRDLVANVLYQDAQT